MKIIERKREVFLKGEGAKMMLRISLPRTEEATELNLLYTRLESEYLRLAREFLSCACDEGTYFLYLSYGVEMGKKDIKIKRRALLKNGRTALRECVYTDRFNIENLRVKG